MTGEGECDCCGKTAMLTRCWVFGIETFACAACRGEDEMPTETEIRDGRLQALQSRDDEINRLRAALETNP